MTQQQAKISVYVLRGELLDSDNLNENYNVIGGPNIIKSREGKVEWLIKHVPALTLSEYFDLEYVRICSNCGKPMGWGYCVECGNEYYCSDECLHHKYSEEEWVEMYDNGNGTSYYTAWID